MRIHSLLCLSFAALLLLPVAATAAAEDGKEKEQEERQLTRDDIPARIASAEVGEWVLYRTGEGKRSRLTVVEKWTEHKDTYLIIRNEITDSRGKRISTKEEKVCVADAVRDLRDLGSEDRISEAEILVQGRKIRAVVLHFVVDGVVVRQSYLSDKIPVHGLIKGVSPKAKVKNALTLIDYGFAEGEVE